ncbi:hypothetical protein [Planotetraspora sp. GP83]
MLSTHGEALAREALDAFFRERVTAAQEHLTQGLPVDKWATR